MSHPESTSGSEGIDRIISLPTAETEGPKQYRPSPTELQTSHLQRDDGRLNVFELDETDDGSFDFPDQELSRPIGFDDTGQPLTLQSLLALQVQNPAAAQLQLARLETMTDEARQALFQLRTADMQDPPFAGVSALPTEERQQFLLETEVGYVEFLIQEVIDRTSYVQR